MKSEINNIKIIYKFGAFGNPNSFGTWIYGRRPDGRTVACKNETTESGGKRVWSYWRSPSCKENEVDVCETLFTKEEWAEILAKPKELQSLTCNQILRNR